MVDIKKNVYYPGKYNKEVLDLTGYATDKEKQDAMEAYESGSERKGTVNKILGSVKDTLIGYRTYFTKEKVDTRSASYWEDYYCGSDVIVLIGDTWVDDIITIQYTNTNNKSPMYGYMSEEFDAVAKGTRIVQGQFAIAFKEIGYLYNILNRYEKKNAGVDEKIVEFGDGKFNPEVEESDEQPTSVLQPLNSKEIIQSKNLSDRFGYKTDEINGNYVRVDGFDVVISFGDVSESFRGGTVEIINNVHITSRSIVCEPTGEPIAEIYSFFGRAVNKYIPKYKYIVGTDKIADDADLTEKEVENTIKEIQVPKVEIISWMIREDIYNEHLKTDPEVFFFRNTYKSTNPNLNFIVVTSGKNLNDYGTTTSNPEGKELNDNIKQFVDIDKRTSIFTKSFKL